jgi:hypothetical protein
MIGWLTRSKACTIRSASSTLKPWSVRLTPL